MGMPSYSLSSLGQDEEESRRDLRLRARSCSVLDISSVLAEAAGAIVDDSFTCCFKSSSPGQRKWNIYRFPLWCLWVVIRFVLLVLSFMQRKMIGMMCHVFVASWNGMVKYHGPLSSIQSDQVFVANHTSIIDFIILEKKTTFAVVMQEYSGWIGFLQKFILESVGCIRFNRNSNSERESVARKLQEHVQLPDNNPLLIFPEGTCVNNQYTVMFKKAAFELGCSVCPIAIKYDKRFTDAFWDSKKHSFAVELFRLMTSWAVVCDVWFLDPQQIMPGETAIEFAERVRDMIAAQVGLKKVPWDGYMKHNRPGPRHTQEKQRIYAESALRILEEN